jgi:hypothetical protein
MGINHLIKKIESELYEASPLLRFPFAKTFVFSGLANKLIDSATDKESIMELRDECQVVQGATGLPWEKIFCLQYIYDFLQSGAGVSGLSAITPGACTVGVVKRSNDTFFIRAMDWSVPDGISDFTEVQKKQDGQSVVGFPGFLGSVTAFGNNFLFAMNQSPSRSFFDGGLPTCYFAEQFRRLVSSMVANGKSLRQGVKTVVNLMDIHDGFAPMSSCMLFIADAEVALVIEIDKGKPTLMERKLEVGKPVCLSNHFLSTTNRKKNVTSGDEDELDWIDDSQERYDDMKKVLSQFERFTPAIVPDSVNNDTTANLTMGRMGNTNRVLVI